MKTIINTTLTSLKYILFPEKGGPYLAEFRVWLAFKIMPKDLANFMLLILNKLSDKYEKMDQKNKQKISTLLVDFDFSE